MNADMDAIVERLAGMTVLVVGDLILDEYIIGRATRMSREAPVPVLEFESRRYIAGGGANPAANIVSLGSRALQVGVVGDDEAGERLLDALRDCGIEGAGIIRCDARTTTVKTRVLAQMGLRFPQQVTRIDRVSRDEISGTQTDQIMSYMESAIGGVDAVLLSHYHGGLLRPALVSRMRALCDERGVLLTGDAQGSFDDFKGLDVIKCNSADAGAYLGRELRTDAQHSDAASELKRALDIKLAAIITRGGNGATLATGEITAHCPAPRVVDVYDTVGAGDTAIAVITLGLAAGLTPAEAVTMANCASGVVVSQLGNYAPTADELRRGMLGAD